MAGLHLTRSGVSSLIGDLVVITDGDGLLYGLDFAGNGARLDRLVARYWPRARVAAGPAPDLVANALAAYFAGRTDALDALSVAQGGTSFQRQVWAALRRIPAGTTCSYGDIARQLGRPKAVRAVGQANSANPVSLVQPCHRVIASGGGPGGYAGGLERKARLLAHEGVRLQT